MIKYRVVCSDSTFVLQEEIEYLLSQGWQCQGGVSAFLQPAGYTQIVMYTQAVIKDDTESVPLKEMII